MLQVPQTVGPEARVIEVDERPHGQPGRDEGEHGRRLKRRNQADQVHRSLG